ncbi:MAG TPA: glycosyltransferase family 39 protein [Patescibacteria group bacterium]|nr:glycosyltransferase family 39 protein [Patescibacteria group bacterium]
MQLIKLYKVEIIIGILIFVLYFVSRLLFLTNLPIFTDEAIYIRWAQIALHDANWRFISLTDGKQPLFIWIMMFFLKFIQDPLTAGRLLSVLAGAGSIIGLWLLSWELFKNKTVSFLSALLYVFYPLALIHDRLAIYDSMVAMLYIWALYFSILFVRKVSLTRSYNLGFILGASVLTKSGGFISMALLPFTLFLFNFHQQDLKQKLIRFIGFGIIAVIIGNLMYGILRLSPFYGTIATKNDVFLYTLNEWLQHPLDWKVSLFLWNLHGMLGWFIQYLNVLSVVFLLIGLAIGSYWKEKAVLAIYFLLPFLYTGAFGKVLFPRYILFMTVVLLPIIALGIIESGKRLSGAFKHLNYAAVTTILFILVILPSAYVSYMWITDPLNAPIPTIDKGQYVGSWPSGWGVKEAIDYIKSQSVNQKVILATQGTFGLMPFSFEMYFQGDPNVATKSYWPIEKTPPADLLALAKTMPVYMYFYQPCDNCPLTGVAPVGWPVTQVFSISKNNGSVHVDLYKFNSPAVYAKK